MSFIRKPLVDQWYCHLDKGGSFRVVAIDEDAGTIEVQHFDGDVEEIDLADWYGMSVEPIPPPEDWTGPMDEVERDDLGYTDAGAEENEARNLTAKRIEHEFEHRDHIAELSEGEDA